MPTMNLLNRLNARLELFRLEQRYTKRRHRRTTFVSEAQYVDGEYIYAMPPGSGSPTTSPSSRDAIDAPLSPVDDVADSPIVAKRRSRAHLRIPSRRRRNSSSSARGRD
ncbi:MAG: hypothetical protein M1818_007847 [Claussenomyces sp. TS43310]|nr:MAG: hypothetical protein M1818_007847 [Claussenomyces sp. TS43310]